MASLKDLIVQGASRFIGDVIGTKFIVSNGTSSQFLKADGSLDSTSFSSATEVSTALGGKVNTGDVVTAITSSTSASTAPVSTVAVASLIKDNEEITAAAFNDINDKIGDIETLLASI